MSVKEKTVLYLTTLSLLLSGCGKKNNINNYHIGTEISPDESQIIYMVEDGDRIVSGPYASYEEAEIAIEELRKEVVLNNIGDYTLKSTIGYFTIISISGVYYIYKVSQKNKTKEKRTK